MHDNYRILVMTSDKYLPAIRVFAYLLNRYWLPNPEVVVSGFSPPEFLLPQNFTFLSVGKQEDFPFEKWSDALYLTLDQFRDDIFVLMLEDYWLTRHVNVQAVGILADYMRSHTNVLKGDLSTDRLYAAGTDMCHDKHDYLDIIRSDPASAYHMSLWPGLWNSENLLRVLVPNESPHDLELTGTTRLSKDFSDLIVVGTRQNPLAITLGLRARDYTKINTNELNKEDFEYLRNNGYFIPWGVK